MSVTKKLINKHTLSLASNAVMPVVGMVTVGLLARYLSPGGLSNWVLFLTTFTLANLFRSGFLQTSLVKFYSGADEDRAKIVAGSTWYIGFMLTAALAVVSIMVLLFYRGEPTIVLASKWFAIIFFSTLPSSVALWILQAEERFDRIFFLQLIWQGCFLVLIIVLIAIHRISFPIVIIAYCSTAMVTSIFSIVKGWAKMNTIKHKTSECVKQLANFGKYSVGTSVSSYMLRGSDTYIIKFMFAADPMVVGIYYLPQRLMEVIEVPLRSFVATALPAMSAAVNRNDMKYLTYILKKYAGILTLLILPVTLGSFIFADVVIDILGGHQYAHSNASNIFRIFMCYALFMPVDRFFGITLDMLNKPHINMTKVIIMLIVNIAGDFAGIAIFHNLYGVALASILTFFAGVTYGYWVLRKYLDFSIFGIIQLGFYEGKILVGELVSKYRNRNKVESEQTKP